MQKNFLFPHYGYVFVLEMSTICLGFVLAITTSNTSSCRMENQEFELLPQLARRQPVIDRAKLKDAPSVEAALEIAKNSMS